MSAPAKGLVFTHERYLDANRQPVQMKVTRVTKTAVYFTYADAPTNKGAWYLDRKTWDARYGN